MTDAESLRVAVWSSWAELQETLESAAEELGASVYLVGGYVRDLLLGREPVDFDLTVEGNGIALAEKVAAAASGTIDISARFRTALITLPDGRRIDVATARAESYSEPGALPNVEPATILVDLERRDFSVNTFALGIAGDYREELLSSTGARTDLERGSLRVLHARSFLDDPTRILRAVRLEIGLQFGLDKQSEALAQEAIGAGALERISGERLWNDLRPLLSEPSLAGGSLERIADLDALESIVPGLAWGHEQQDCLSAATRELRLWEEGDSEVAPDATVALVALLVLASSPAGEYLGSGLADRLSLPREARRVLERWPDDEEWARRVLDSGEVAPSDAHTALADLSLAELAFLSGQLEPENLAWVRREIFEFRRIRLQVRADDLLAAGHQPGPAIGRALESTLAARLDGEIGPEAELDYALSLLGEPGRGDSGSS